MSAVRAAGGANRLPEAGASRAKGAGAVSAGESQQSCGFTRTAGADGIGDYFSMGGKNSQLLPSDNRITTKNTESHIFLESMRLLLVAVGGAIGSTLRYLLDGEVYRWLPATFPYGTFVVNVVGCGIFGLLVGVGEQFLVVGSPARTFLLIGIIGGFTTFSSFAFETIQLLRDGEWWLGAVNAIGQVVIGLVALWAGFAIGRVLQGAS